MKDGWHTVCGFYVYIEDDYILRGMKEVKGSFIPTWPFFSSKKGAGYDRVSKVKVSTFRKGFYRGNYMMI